MTKRYNVGKSKIHGKGIFATVDFKKGDRVLILPGKISRRKIRTEKEAMRFINWVCIGKNLWLNPNQTNARHVNHSCDPNTTLAGRTLYAIKSIRRGEEITFDYSLTDTDRLWNMECNCGVKKCRKNVGSVHSLPRKTFLSLISRIPSHARTEYLLTSKYEEILHR